MSICSAYDMSICSASVALDSASHSPQTVIQHLQKGSMAGLTKDTLQASEAVMDDGCVGAVVSRDKLIDPHTIRHHHSSMPQPPMV